MGGGQSGWIIGNGESLLNLIFKNRSRDDCEILTDTLFQMQSLREVINVNVSSYYEPGEALAIKHSQEIGDRFFAIIFRASKDSDFLNATESFLRSINKGDNRESILRNNINSFVYSPDWEWHKDLTRQRSNFSLSSTNTILTNPQNTGPSSTAPSNSPSTTSLLTNAQNTRPPSPVTLN